MGRDYSQVDCPFIWYHNSALSISLWCFTRLGLGLLLFVLYTADISSIIAAHGLLYHCYADDTQIYFYCCPSECAALKGTFLSCIDAVAILDDD